MNQDLGKLEIMRNQGLEVDQIEMEEGTEGPTIDEDDKQMDEEPEIPSDDIEEE